MKVQAALQDKQVRVSGKSRDGLQEAIAVLRKAKLDAEWVIGCGALTAS